MFILVCKNTAIAKVIYEWLAEDTAPTGIPPAKIEGFRNRDGMQQHDPRRLEGGPRNRRPGGQQKRRDPLDASDAGHGGQDRLAEGPAGPADLSRGL